MSEFSSCYLVSASLDPPHPPHLLVILRRNTSKAKVGQLHPSVLRKKDILSFEVSVHTLPRVEVGDGPRAVDREADPQSPREGEGPIVNVLTEVAAGEVFRDDEDSLTLLGGDWAVRKDVGRGSSGSEAEAEILHDVGVTSFGHDLAFSLEVFVDC